MKNILIVVGILGTTILYISSSLAEESKIFRYQQCEKTHSEKYCDCLIGHVNKRIGFIDKLIWLNGGELTDGDGLKALAEAYQICAEIERRELQEKTQEIKKEWEKTEKEIEDKNKKILSYSDKFCNVGSFIQLIDSRNKYNTEKLELPIDDIVLQNRDGKDLCKVVFRCTWCKEEAITLFFVQSEANKYEFDVNQGTDATNTLYSMATWINNIDTVKDLINKGADINYKYKEKANSFFAMMGTYDFDIAKLCVENGANVNDVFYIESYGTNTLLTQAVQYNEIETVKLFIANGADPNIPNVVIDKNGTKTETLPVERTIHFSDETMLKILLENGAKIPEYGYVDEQQMPLIWAVMLGNQENLVKRLELWLSNGADVNAEYRFNKEIKIRRKDGYKRISPTYRAQKPVEYAEQDKMFDVVELLQKYGATPKHELTNLRWCNMEKGKQICGTFTNNTNETIKMLHIIFNLYDSDKARVGEASVFSTNVMPQEKLKFRTTDDIASEVTSYKVQDIATYDY